MLRTRLHQNLHSSITLVTRFPEPTPVLQIRVPALALLTPRRRALTAFTPWHMHLYTSIHKWAEVRVLRPSSGVAIYRRQVVPDLPFGHLERVFNLDDSCGRDFVVRLVADLERDAAGEGFGVYQGVNDGAAVWRHKVVVNVVAGELRSFGSHGPEVEGVGAVVEESDGGGGGGGGSGGSGSSGDTCCPGQEDEGEEEEREEGWHGWFCGGFEEEKIVRNS